MRLLWSREALDDLAVVADRAPRQARRVLGAVEGLVELPFPGMFRRVEGRPGEHVLSVPPHAVFYLLAGDQLVILAIVDARRRRAPW